MSHGQCEFPSGIVASCNTTYGAPWTDISGCMDRRDGYRWITLSFMRVCIFARSLPAQNSMSRTPLATLRIFRQRLSISPIAFKTTRSPSHPAKRVCETWVTSPRFIAQRESPFRRIVGRRLRFRNWLRFPTFLGNRTLTSLAAAIPARWLPRAKDQARRLALASVQVLAA